MDNDLLRRRVLLLTLTLGRRALLLGFVLGLLALVMALLWLLQAVHLVVGITAVATLLAYVLAPGVNYLNRERGINRILAIVFVYFGVGLLFLLALTYGIPAVREQFDMMSANLPHDMGALKQTLGVWHQNLVAAAPAFLQPTLQQFDPQTVKIEDYVGDVTNSLPGMLGTTMGGVFAGAKAVFGIMATCVLVPLFTFYILMDSTRYKDGFIRLFPRQWKRDVEELMRDIDHVLGSYIRGQLLVCFTIGVSVAIVLSLLGLRYATLIGVFAGCVDIIPYVGVALGMVPAVVIALIYKGFAWAVLVVVCLEIVHWSEGHIIVPAVIGHSVGLPPLVVMIALGAGAELGGVMGMFLSIPLAAIFRVLVMFYVKKLEQAESLLAGPRKEIPLPFTNGPAADVPSTPVNPESASSELPAVPNLPSSEG